MANSVDPDQTASILLKFVSNVRQLFAADDFSRHFQMHFFLCALRVNSIIFPDFGQVPFPKIAGKSPVFSDCEHTKAQPLRIYHECESRIEKCVPRIAV